MSQMRINKFIACAGYTSRRKADELIKAGKVILNGSVVTELGTIVDTDKDYVKIENKTLKIRDSYLYYVLNKPVSYLSANSDNFNENLARDLIPYRGHLFNVGRLDADTDGLLIYTTDGDFANIMTHPSYYIEKKYSVVCEGNLTDDIIKNLEEGVLLDDGMTAKAKINLKKRMKYISRLEITISEGRNRQIRRMFEAFGLNVKELTRLSHGKINLLDLQKGHYREFTRSELQYVKDLKKKYKKG